MNIEKIYNFFENATKSDSEPYVIEDKEDS